MHGGKRGDAVGSPRTLSFCTACAEYTPHKWVEGDGVVAKICVRCIGRELPTGLNRG